MKVFQSTVERSLYALLGIVFVALLIISYYLIQQNTEVKTILNNQANSIKSAVGQTKAIEQNDNMKLQDLQNPVDCLFKLATTPHTTTAPPVILDINTCSISPSSSGSATVAPKVISPVPVVTTPSPLPPSPPVTITPSKSRGIGGLIQQILSGVGL